jgi:hypothetical protein
MGCVLHFTGEATDTNELIRLSPIPPDVSFRKGEITSTRPGARPARISGIAIVISDADFEDFETMQSDAVTFLKTYQDSLIKLRNVHGITHASIDFGISMRNVVSQSDTFCAELIQCIALFRLDLNLSQYPVARKMRMIRRHRRALRKNAL